MTDKRRNTPHNSDATHRQFRSQKTSQRQSCSSKTASQSHQNAYPKRRPTNPEPVERTLRSSERINRIREQGAKRTQVQPPRQPFNQVNKKQSQPASMRPAPKPHRSQSASTKGCALFPRERKQHLNERGMALNRHPDKTMPCPVIAQIQHSGKESQTLQGTQLQPWANHILPRASILKIRLVETDLLQGSVPVMRPMLALKPCQTTRK